MSYPTERHANYLTARLDDADGVDYLTFRLGDPDTWDRAQNVHEACDQAIRGGSLRVRYGRRWYLVSYAEVRTVDQYDRGLGSERHRTARIAREVA